MTLDGVPLDAVPMDDVPMDAAQVDGGSAVRPWRVEPIVVLVVESW